MNVAILALFISACGGSRSGETATPTATTDTPVESSEVLLAPTYTPYPAYTPYPTYTRPPTGAPTPAETATVETTAPVVATAPIIPIGTEAPQEPTEETPAPAATAPPTAPPAPQEGASPSGEVAQTMPVSQASAGQPVELTRIEDTDPGPPFTILVSTIRIKENGYYKVTGKVRNNGSEIYGGVGIGATFFTELECGERAVAGQGKQGKRGGAGSGSVEHACDPNWHGTGKVYVACQLLEPGAECPFSLEIYPRDYVAYRLHPDGTPVEYRQPVSLALSNLGVDNDWFGYVRITGTATNGNPFAVRDANIAGVLIDVNGQIVSVGWTLVPGEIAPGASIAFELHIEQAPYANHELQAQATQN